MVTGKSVVILLMVKGLVAVTDGLINWLQVNLMVKGLVTVTDELINWLQVNLLLSY